MSENINSKIVELKGKGFDIVETIKRHKQIIGQLDQEYVKVIREIMALQQKSQNKQPSLTKPKINKKNGNK